MQSIKRRPRSFRAGHIRSLSNLLPATTMNEGVINMPASAPLPEKPKVSARIAAKKIKASEGRPRDACLTLLRSCEEQSKMSGDAGNELTFLLCYRRRLCNAAPSTKRARKSVKKLVSPPRLVPPHQKLDKLESAHVGQLPLLVLLSHPNHATDAVSGGYKSSSSQDSLEARYIKKERCTATCKWRQDYDSKRKTKKNL